MGRQLKRSVNARSAQALRAKRSSKQKPNARSAQALRAKRTVKKSTTKHKTPDAQAFRHPLTSIQNAPQPILDMLGIKRNPLEEMPRGVNLRQMLMQRQIPGYSGPPQTLAQGQIHDLQNAIVKTGDAVKEIKLQQKQEDARRTAERNVQAAEHQRRHHEQVMAFEDKSNAIKDDIQQSKLDRTSAELHNETEHALAQEQHHQQRLDMRQRQMELDAVRRRTQALQEQGITMQHEHDIERLSQDLLNATSDLESLAPKPPPNEIPPKTFGERKPTNIFGKPGAPFKPFIQSPTKPTNLFWKPGTQFKPFIQSPTKPSDTPASQSETPDDIRKRVADTSSISTQIRNTLDYIGKLTAQLRELQSNKGNLEIIKSSFDGDAFMERGKALATLQTQNDNIRAEIVAAEKRLAEYRKLESDISDMSIEQDKLKAQSDALGSSAFADTLKKTAQMMGQRAALDKELKAREKFNHEADMLRQMRLTSDVQQRLHHSDGLRTINDSVTVLHVFNNELTRDKEDRSSNSDELERFKTKHSDDWRYIHDQIEYDLDAKWESCSVNDQRLFLQMCHDWHNRDNSNSEVYHNKFGVTLHPHERPQRLRLGGWTPIEENDSPFSQYTLDEEPRSSGEGLIRWQSYE